jgi:hypothetical protein
LYVSWHKLNSVQNQVFAAVPKGIEVKGKHITCFIITVIYLVVGQSIIVANINIINQRIKFLFYQTPATDNRKWTALTTQGYLSLIAFLGFKDFIALSNSLKVNYLLYYPPW